MTTPTTRVSKLRAHALDARPNMRSEEGSLLWLRAWQRHADASSVEVRGAHAMAAMHAGQTPVIDEGELIVGKPCYRTLEESEREELAALRAGALRAIPAMRGQASHMAIDYEKLLTVGIVGLLAEIDERAARLDEADPECIESVEFYAACRVALAGILDMEDAYARHARALAERCDRAERARELLEIADVLEHVPRYPARSFREAVQCAHFCTWPLEGLNQLGRPDRYLWKFYERDMAAHALTRERAQELIDCLCILYSEYIPGGLAAGLMVGGRDAHGKGVENELTELFLRSVGHVRMIYPGVGLCWHPGTPQPLADIALELLADGCSHPALFNDVVITEGLRHYGLPPEDACEYIHSTCVEITPCAGSAVWVASPYHNLAQPVLDVLSRGAPEELADYAAFQQAVRERIARAVRAGVIEENREQYGRAKGMGYPLVSCFVRDCLARGRDVDRGGARYNWIMPSFVGMANLLDSLTSVRALIYEEKRYTPAGLAAILASDFAGNEPLRMEILSRLPKYGNDADEADDLAAEITRWIVDEVGKYRTYRGDRFIPSLFCWVMHEYLGTRTGATPDGRPAGFPLGDGSGPAQGRERCGPTASVLSSTKWEHTPFIGGIAVNLKFPKTLFDEGKREKLRALVETYMQRGGFELQVNAVDRAVLLDAQKHPEQHRDLVVRIGGYSDYFVNLTPAMQAEVLLRTEHAL